MLRDMPHFLILLIFLHGCTNESDSQANKNSPDIRDRQNKSGSFILSSNDFLNGGIIPPHSACKWLGGENRAPQLNWTNIPPETGKLAIVMDDETRNSGDKATKHWAVFNIPPSTTNLSLGKENETSHGITQGQNYTKKIGYAGPCPPKLHRYSFTLYALRQEMPLIKDGTEFTRSQFMRKFSDYIIDSTTLLGSYKPPVARRFFNKVKEFFDDLLR